MTDKPTQVQIKAVATVLEQQFPNLTRPVSATIALAALTAAAEVGPTVEDLMKDPVAAMNAAAEGGDYWYRAIDPDQQEPDLDPATIKRCAQVADKYEWPVKPKYPSQPVREVKEGIAAAIHALMRKTK